MMVKAVIGREERDWIDSIIAAACQDIRHEFDLEDAHVILLVRDSLKRMEKEL